MGAISKFSAKFEAEEATHCIPFEFVKQHNMDEVREYSKLVALGQPDFIEIKSVTFRGKSDASDLTFENVPFHEEVLALLVICATINQDSESRQKNSMQFETKEIMMAGHAEEYAKYEICSEHQHSNLVLLAKTSYKVDGKWNTWIDYPKFSALWRKWKESNGNLHSQPKTIWQRRLTGPSTVRKSGAWIHWKTAIITIGPLDGQRKVNYQSFSWRNIQ